MDEGQYTSHDLGHLGIVAGMCRHIELAKTIDDFVGPLKGTPRKVSVGHAVVAMVLNGLGFVGRALYLTPEFYRNKPVDILIGEGLCADDLNAYSLGRALEHLYDAGLTEIFAHVAQKALNVIGISASCGHLDTTSISLHGEYAKQDEHAQVRLTQGYSKDGHPELAQIVVSLICEASSSIPMYFEALSGNSNDSRSFRETLGQFHEQLRDDMPFMWVADSKFYCLKTLRKLPESGRFVTRVPRSINACTELCLSAKQELMTVCHDERYRLQEHRSNYAQVAQRWVLFHSLPQQQRQERTLQNQLQKEHKRVCSELGQLSKRRFRERILARAALNELEQGWSYHQVEALQWHDDVGYDKAGRPRKGEPPRQFWSLEASACPDEQALSTQRKGQGMFVLATNVLDAKELSCQAMLELYKRQNVTVERGFRFLKEPMFFAHGLYIQKPKRIMAMLCVMTLCLLIYALAEHTLRANMRHNNETLPDQKGKPTQNITMRRVFQMFEGIHVLIIGSAGQRHRMLLNLTPIHRQILTFLPQEVLILYEKPP